MKLSGSPPEEVPLYFVIVPRLNCYCQMSTCVEDWG
jgi:hypothetical protein